MIWFSIVILLLLCLFSISSFILIYAGDFLWILIICLIIFIIWLVIKTLNMWDKLNKCKLDLRWICMGCSMEIMAGLNSDFPFWADQFSKDFLVLCLNCNILPLSLLGRDSPEIWSFWQTGNYPSACFTDCFLFFFLLSSHLNIFSPLVVCQCMLVCIMNISSMCQYYNNYNNTVTLSILTQMLCYLKLFTTI